MRHRGQSPLSTIALFVVDHNNVLEDFVRA